VTTERLTIPATRLAAAWTGRASQHRREQVQAREDHPLAAPPSGPSAADGPVEALWRNLTEVLDALETPAQAMLCTTDGVAIVSYGYHRADLSSAAHLAGKMFSARRLEAVPATSGSGTLTVQLTSGLAHTVIAAFPTARGRHLLSISADGVSLPVLEAWTRHTADRLSVTLGGQQDA
jgi:hypothetical protein